MNKLSMWPARDTWIAMFWEVVMAVAAGAFIGTFLGSVERGIVASVEFWLARVVFIGLPMRAWAVHKASKEPMTGCSMCGAEAHHVHRVFTCCEHNDGLERALGISGEGHDDS